jgi:hypothetical protein
MSGKHENLSSATVQNRSAATAFNASHLIDPDVSSRCAPVLNYSIVNLLIHRSHERAPPADPLKLTQFKVSARDVRGPTEELEH